MFKKTLMKEITTLFSKNKMTLIVLFVLPVFVAIMLGIEMQDESLSDIPLAVIDKDHSELSRKLIDSFDSNNTFNVTQYLTSEDALNQMLANSQVRVGLIIPEHFYADIVTLKSPSVLMVYDGSHMSMTGAAKAKATEILLTYKAGVSVKQISARLSVSEESALDIANMFSFQNVTLYNENKSYEKFLAPILVAGCIQSALALSCARSIDQNIVVIANKKRKGYFGAKVLAYAVLGVISFSICMPIQVFIFGLPFKGNVFDSFLLLCSFCFAVSSFATLISLLFKNQQMAVIASGILFIPNSIMAGTTWPLISMPIGYRAFAQYVPFARFVNHFRDVYLKEVNIHHFSNDILYFIIFGLLFTFVGEMIVFLLEKKEDGINQHDFL